MKQSASQSTLLLPPECYLAFSKLQKEYIAEGLTLHVFFLLFYKGCKWKRISGRVRDHINVSGVIVHSPVTVIYIPGVLQQLQGQWNPCMLTVGAN
jgi:hypothetical protein